VTTTKAGMAVEDGFTTYGHQLFLYPWTTWFAGPWDLFVEHGHRLLGATVGMITIALCLTIWRCDDRPWMRVLGVAALLLVIAQGVLGGIRVELDQVRLAQIHGCVGPLFFSLAVAIAAFTSRWWHRTDSQVVSAGKFRRMALITTGLAYLQIVLGSNLRHIPPAADHGIFGAALVFHLMVAAVIAVQVAILAVSVWRTRPGLSLTLPASILAALLAVQLMFGVATWIWKYGIPFEFMQDWQPFAGWVNTAGSMSESLIITAHVATGSLILVTALLISLRSVRFSYLSARLANRMGGVA